MLLTPGIAGAKTYFVRTTGDDDNIGTSAQKPFATIARAAEVATNGDVVYVGTGRYTDPVYVIGAKDSTRRLRIVADTTGINTGDAAGRVVVGNATFRVAGSNYVEIEGFIFSGESAFPVIWEGSYEGRLYRCTFVGGDRSLLMKAGSLLLESCHFSNFKDDAIQIDDVAKLAVRDCTITASGGHGIDIRKSAIATVDNSFITDNVGDGLHVETRLDSIVLDDIPKPDCECTGTSPLDLKRQAYDILRSLSPADEVFQHVISSAATDVQEAMDSKLWRDDWHVDIPAGPGVYEQTVEAVTKLNAVLSDEVDFEIIGDLIKVKHPFVAEVTVVGAAIASGSTPVPVTMKFKVGNQTFEPFGNFNNGNAGDVNDNNNPRTYETTETFEADDTIVVTGRSWSTSGSSVSMTVDSNSQSANLYTLRDGDNVPNVAGYNGQASAEEFLQPYINSDNVVTLADNQVILLYELGTTNLSSSAADFQDLVVVVNLKKSHESTALTDEEIAKIKQAIELLLDSDAGLANCSIDESTVGGGDRDNLNGAQKHYADAEAARAAGLFAEASQAYRHAWDVSKRSTGGRDVDPHADFAQQIQPVPPSDWSPVRDAVVEIGGSKFTGNDSGVSMVSSQAFTASSSEFSDNKSWGLSLRGRFKMESCTMSTNGTGGIRLLDMNDGDFGFARLTLTDNRDYGLFLDNCRLTFNDTLYQALTISGSNHVIGSKGGTLALEGVTITGGSVAGVYTHQGVLTLLASRVTGNGYGVTAKESEVAIEKCALNSNLVGLFAESNVGVKVSGTTMSGNTVAVYANQNSAMTLAQTDISGSTAWGVILLDPTTKTTLDTCTVSNGPNGVFLANLVDGDVDLKSTVISDNSLYGLHFENCTLTVADQATNAWRTLRNGYGISANQSTLTLANPSVEDSTLYGLYCTNSTINVTGGTVTSNNGLFLETNNVSFTADGTRFLATATSGNLGVTHKGGDLTLRNSLVKNFASGAQLASAAGSSNIENVTLVGVTGTGITVDSGTASVKNTIVAGSGSTGVNRAGGSLTHTHNIVYGFTTPFLGTTAHDTESTKTPRFVDASAGDYHLSSASPAINAGVDLGIVNYTDIEGNARPSFHGHEIGAYEYMSDSSSYRVLDWQETK